MPTIHLLPVLLLTLAWTALASGVLFAQPEPTDTAQTGVLDATALLAIAEDGVSYLDSSGELDHYDAHGYPEDAAGRLVWRAHEDGPLVFVQDDPIGYLLYAQYVNRQREAVFLARTGDIRDPLPNGTTHVIPFGYGAVRFSSVWVSILEARPVPHFSDNQKTYTTFRLYDVYGGVLMSSSGIMARARLVLGEQYAAWMAAGYNWSGSIADGGIRDTYEVPVSIGGGYRFPGPLSGITGPTLWTLGGELLVGFGDRDDDPATGWVVGLPGVVLSIERVLYDDRGRDVDFRTDPRPYNYRIASVAAEIGVYLNLGRSPLVLPSVGISVATNVVGPSIPDHEFKTTRMIYLNPQYREDLEQQIQRRQARADRDSQTDE